MIQSSSIRLAVVWAGLQAVSLHGAPPAELNTRLQKWERGVLVQSVRHSDMKMYLWFYEWHMFGTMRPEQHTRGNWTNRVSVTSDGRSATVVSGNPGIQLELQAVRDGAQMRLNVTNRSQHDWPELAALIACFNPGPEMTRNRQFANTKTWFPGPDGLASLAMKYSREIHFNSSLRLAVDGAADSDGKYVWSDKWPKSAVDAMDGLIIRESTDGNWVTGIAWDRFLSCQGHNPWECMHLSARLGPLKRGESRQLRGHIYLFRGSKEDVLELWQDDSQPAADGTGSRRRKSPGR